MLRILYPQSGGIPPSPAPPSASASSIECPPSPSKSHPAPLAEKLQGPPPSPSPPYPFTLEVHVTEGVKPTKKIKGLADQPKGAKHGVLNYRPTQRATGGPDWGPTAFLLLNIIM
ncbi:hypothetical protein PoB_004143700 [Plakobranchus ocellatus]|uniref:Uncharacterized protein n=1 Tax=Plakobranchus ocellatus TaxID=259542 RepID=A0AAV4B5Z2_9GAST|nr:hypothetical protein PoB_004143700 [Plakobranchus ocellatus]